VNIIMAAQYGFYFDEDRCVGCLNCVVACKSVNNLEQGIKWMKVNDKWEGEYPDIKRNFMISTCLHCEDPACVKVCPTGAIFKREEDGIVVVEKDKCNGCRECYEACPWHIPEFGSDGLMQKCDYCLSAGREPECAATCPAEALKFGPLEDLYRIAQSKNKKAERLGGETNPALIIVSR
jgi:anaerobic dimethyl sulfoxide reductase subunit B